MCQVPLQGMNGLLSLPLRLLSSAQDCSGVGKATGDNTVDTFVLSCRVHSTWSPPPTKTAHEGIVNCAKEEDVDSRLKKQWYSSPYVTEVSYHKHTE